jgi:hypothetical protein
MINEDIRANLANIRIISELLTHLKFSHQLTYDKRLCQSIELRCHTMAKKVEIIKLSLMRETYSPDAVVALKKIR